MPSTTGGRRRVESRERLRFDAGEPSVSATDTNNTSFATWSTTKRMIEEVWRSKATSIYAACNYTYRYRYNHGSLGRIKQPREIL